LAAKKGHFDLLIDRPTVIFLTVEPPVNARSTAPGKTRLLVDRPVDRA